MFKLWYHQDKQRFTSSHTGAVSAIHFSDSPKRQRCDGPEVEHTVSVSLYLSLWIRESAVVPLKTFLWRPPKTREIQEERVSLTGDQSHHRASSRHQTWHTSMNITFLLFSWFMNICSNTITRTRNESYLLSPWKHTVDESELTEAQYKENSPVLSWSSSVGTDRVWGCEPPTHRWTAAETGGEAAPARQNWTHEQPLHTMNTISSCVCDQSSITVMSYYPFLLNSYT